MTISQYKTAFLQEAEKICDEMGIVIGYNEKPNGFEVGFEHAQDHAPFMEKIEAAIAARAHDFQPMHDTTIDLLADALEKDKIWNPQERANNIRKMTSPVITIKHNHSLTQYLWFCPW